MATLGVGKLVWLSVKVRLLLSAASFRRSCELTHHLVVLCNGLFSYQLLILPYPPLDFTLVKRKLFLGKGTKALLLLIINFMLPCLLFSKLRHTLHTLSRPELRGAALLADVRVRMCLKRSGARRGERWSSGNWCLTLRTRLSVFDGSTKQSIHYMPANYRTYNRPVSLQPSASRGSTDQPFLWISATSGGPGSCIRCTGIQSIPLQHPSTTILDSIWHLQRPVVTSPPIMPPSSLPSFPSCASSLSCQFLQVPFFCPDGARRSSPPRGPVRQGLLQRRGTRSAWIDGP